MEDNKKIEVKFTRVVYNIVANTGIIVDGKYYNNRYWQNYYKLTDPDVKVSKLSTTMKMVVKQEDGLTGVELVKVYPIKSLYKSFPYDQATIEMPEHIVTTLYKTNKKMALTLIKTYLQEYHNNKINKK